MTDDRRSALADLPPKSRGLLRRVLIDELLGWPQALVGSCRCGRPEVRK